MKDRQVITRGSASHAGHRPLYTGNTLVLFCLAILVTFPRLLIAQTKCVDGFAAGFECSGVHLLSHMDRFDLGGAGPAASDSWGWKDSQTGRYYAIVGRPSMTVFVDITDPVNPVYLGKMPSNLSGNAIWKDIKTFANHAFVVGDISGHGMQVFDLTRLRGVDSPQIFEPDAVYRDIGSSHNLAINEETGYAYLVSNGGPGCEMGLHIVDINTPKSPTMVGCWGDTGRIHDTQCVTYHGPDQHHQGAELCFASDLAGLSIIDVSDKNNIRLLSQGSYPDPGFPHQGWLTEDQRYFVMGDEADEGNGRNTRTIVFDVSDLEQPLYTGSHLGDSEVTDHNQYIKGNYVYQANYSLGLRILQINDLAVADLTEVAHFDTFPFSNNLYDLGAWNVYPFFDNGTLLVSDVNTGLFLLRADVGNEFQINAGLNDAWVSADAPLQGFFFTVFPDLEIFFLSWFTFDSEQPGGGVTSVFGAPDQRWVTGTGIYAGNSVTLNVELTSGGIFNGSNPMASQQTGYGTITIVFNNCNEAVLTYDFPSVGLSGQMTLTRVVPSNVALCESLSSP